jgi:hypothetical protein
MKNIKQPMIILVFIFCINNNLFSQADDNWTDLNNYEELEGQWEGMATSNVKTNLFKSIINITWIFKYKKDDILVTSIINFDFNNLLNDLENTEEAKERSFSKEIIWQTFKLYFQDDHISFDHYSLNFDNSAVASEYFASDSRGKFLINRNKDMLRLIYYEPFILGIGDLGFTEIVFRKK